MYDSSEGFTDIPISRVKDKNLKDQLLKRGEEGVAPFCKFANV